MSVEAHAPLVRRSKGAAQHGLAPSEHHALLFGSGGDVRPLGAKLSSPPHARAQHKLADLIRLNDWQDPAADNRPAPIAVGSIVMTADGGFDTPADAASLGQDMQVPTTTAAAVATTAAAVAAGVTTAPVAADAAAAPGAPTAAGPKGAMG